MKHLPNIITALRIAGSIGLLFCNVAGWQFWTLYVLCGLSDMVDGWLARRLHAESKTGSILDSIADLVFVACCAILFHDNLSDFNSEYLKYTAHVAETCQNRDLSGSSMVIGTSAIIDTELDGAIGMNSGIFNNPFIIWGRYKKRFLRYYLTLSFQFHHTQMDGAHAGKFLANLQNEINRLA